ncbi:MAG: serine/threonine protein kinase [Myxococcales bacterium]|nr:serine/threonine protein kinase [Myxococcales bacterium]
MDPIVGTQIGQYRVNRPIGNGGIGSVFEATHQQIGRRVAIKVLRAEHARNQETVTRLFNEARAVNRVEHPGLVQIFDCDYLPDGRAYLVMEYLHGETLTQRMAGSGGRLGSTTALRIAYQLASILAATHGANIVHRDPKQIYKIPMSHRYTTTQRRRQGHDVSNTATRAHIFNRNDLC